MCKAWLLPTPPPSRAGKLSRITWNAYRAAAWNTHTEYARESSRFLPSSHDPCPPPFPYGTCPSPFPIWHVQVSRIKAGGWAEGADVASGDVIVSVGGTPCRGATLEKITRLLQASISSLTVTFVAVTFVTVTFVTLQASRHAPHSCCACRVLHVAAAVARVAGAVARKGCCTWAGTVGWADARVVPCAAQ